MSERPTFVEEQTKKASHVFDQLFRIREHTDEQTPAVDHVIYKRSGRTDLVIDKQFVQGMKKVSDSLYGDLHSVGEGQRFTEAYRHAKFRSHVRGLQKYLP